MLLISCFLQFSIEIIQYLNQTLKIGPNLNHPHCYTFGLNYFYQTGTNTTNEDDKHIRPKLVLPLEENEISSFFDKHDNIFSEKLDSE